MTDYAYILTKKFPGTLWELSGDKYADILWKCDTRQPTQKELDDLAPIVKAEEEAAAKLVEQKKQAIRDRLGLTADEVKLLLS